MKDIAFPPHPISTSESEDTAHEISDVKFSYSKEIILEDEKELEEMNKPVLVPSKIPCGVPCEVTKTSTDSVRDITTKLSPIIPSIDLTLLSNKSELEMTIEGTPSKKQLAPVNVTKDVSLMTKKQPEPAPSSTDEESTTSSSSSCRAGLQWTQKKSSRVGEQYQTSLLPEAGSYLNIQGDDFDQLEQLLLANQIWDPLKASCKGTNDFVHLNCPSNKKEAALEFLHQRGYDSTGFKEELKKLPVLDGSDWSLCDHENFRKLMQSTRHNVHSVSRSMKKSINNCLTVYYKIINVRETRSSRKKFTGVKPMDEINDLKDIGRSMRIEKRNQRKSVETNDDSDREQSMSKSTNGSKRKKAESKSDTSKKSHRINTGTRSSVRVKRQKVEPQKPTSQGTNETIETRKSPRTLKKEPQRLADEQALEHIIASSVAESFTDKKRMARSRHMEVNHELIEGARKASKSKQRKRSTQRNESVLESKFKTSKVTESLNTYSSENSDTDGGDVSENEDTTIRPAKKKALKLLKGTDTITNCVGGNEGVTDEKNEKGEEDQEKGNRADWNGRFKTLLEFKEANGHCLVPKVYTENKQLSYWVFRQRSLYAKRSKLKGSNPLTKERIQRLKKIGFVFQAKHSEEQVKVDAARRKPQQDAKWNTFFKKFCEYRKKTGTCLIPKVHKEDQPLSSWAFTQRHQMKRRSDGLDNLLNEERVKKLNDIGFVWNAKQNKEWQEADRIRKREVVEVMWHKNYKALLEFKKKHGHTCVPKVYKQNQPLSTWVFRQRAQYRRRCEGDDQIMPQERLDLLQKIDFQFRVRK
mmetsp:Transcript_21791/g.25162  ORF Transcript_21791/g.25162 Transcript_21791/m.25162 type:complete len:810 (-) Transcript_21791:1826-4255(-)